VRAPSGREDIFLDDVDRQELLKTLAEACQKTGWQVHGASPGGPHQLPMRARWAARVAQF